MVKLNIKLNEKYRVVEKLSSSTHHTNMIQFDLLYIDNHSLFQSSLHFISSNTTSLAGYLVGRRYINELNLSVSNLILLLMTTITCWLNTLDCGYRRLDLATSAHSSQCLMSFPSPWRDVRPISIFDTFFLSGHWLCCQCYQLVKLIKLRLCIYSTNLTNLTYFNPINTFSWYFMGWWIRLGFIFFFLETRVRLG